MRSSLLQNEQPHRQPIAETNKEAQISEMTYKYISKNLLRSNSNSKLPKCFKAVLAIAAISASMPLSAWAQAPSTGGDKAGRPLDEFMTETTSVIQNYGHFDKSAFRTRLLQGFGKDRVDMFFTFLKEYNLIGMPKEKVIELLGPSIGAEPNTLTYLLQSGMCGLDFTKVYMELVDGKVSRWRIHKSEDPGVPLGEWVTTNVVCSRNDRLTNRSNPNPFIYTPKGQANGIIRNYSNSK